MSKVFKIAHAPRSGLVEEFISDCFFFSPLCLDTSGREGTDQQVENIARNRIWGHGGGFDQRKMLCISY